MGASSRAGTVPGSLHYPGRVRMCGREGRGARLTVQGLPGKEKAKPPSVLLPWLPGTEARLAWAGGGQQDAVRVSSRVSNGGSS